MHDLTHNVLEGYLSDSISSQDQQNTFAQLMQQMIQQQAAGQDQDNLVRNESFYDMQLFQRLR